MTHRTQLYLDDTQYRFVKDLARKEGKSIAAIIRNWIDERRKKKARVKYENDPLFKLRGIISDKPDVAQNFDDYLYGDKQ